MSDNSGIIIPAVGVNLSYTAPHFDHMPGTPYPEAIRQEAIARALGLHTTVAQVAHDVGCSTDTMHRWLREHRLQK